MSNDVERAQDETEVLNKEDKEVAPPADKAKNWEKYLSYISLIVLVAQNAGQVLITKYATNRKQEQFIKTVAVFFNEVFKLTAATILFFASTGDCKKEHFVTHFTDTLKVGVPAFIYTIQNFLLYVAVEHLDAGTYMVTYQLKILTTALFMVLMLKRRLSVVQWFALGLLAGGVAVVQMSAKKASATVALNVTTTTTLSTIAAEQVERQPVIGFLAVVAASVMSGFAGIYFEKILKGSKVSLWLRNIQLASLAIPIALVVIAVKDGDRVLNRGFLSGFDIIVWLVVACQALGGLIVAVVIKYADNILKAFATSIAIVVASVASIFIFNVIPTWLFIVGASLVIVAVILYGKFPYKARRFIEDPNKEAVPLQDLSDKKVEQEICDEKPAEK